MSAKIKWTINYTQSEISFKVAHLMISSVTGVFRKFDGNIETETNKNEFTSIKIVFWINISSLDTGDKKRDAHMKSAEFFDAKKYKKVTFVSDSFEKSDKEDCYILWGYLTMKGITDRIKLNVQTVGVMKDLYGNDKASFAITGDVNRKDWNMNWTGHSDSSIVMGSDEVQIICKLELQKLNKKVLAIEPAHTV